MAARPSARPPRAPRPDRRPPERPTPKDPLPRGNCRWMCDQFPPMTPPFGGTILALCEDELVMALFAAAPQAGRILRARCAGCSP